MLWQFSSDVQGGPKNKPHVFTRMTLITLICEKKNSPYNDTFSNINKFLISQILYPVIASSTFKA